MTLSPTTRDVFVREVGLRDGIQGLDLIATQDKLEWLRREADAGILAFEATSFVPARIIPQFVDAEDVILQGNKAVSAELSALVLNDKGAQRAVASGVAGIVFVISASATHSGKNARTTPQDALKVVEQLIASVRKLPNAPRITGAIATSFGCTYEGLIAPELVLNLAEGLARAGVDEVSLGDTVGFAGPRQVRAMFTSLSALLGKDIPLGAHFHDTRGMGMANVLAALDVGVRRFDASLGGLGGCPFAPGATGNIATEDLCFLLGEYGLNTGVDLQKLLDTRRWLAQLLPNEPLHGALSQAGLPRALNLHL